MMQSVTHRTLRLALYDQRLQHVLHNQMLMCIALKNIVTSREREQTAEPDNVGGDGEARTALSLHAAEVVRNAISADTQGAAH